MTLNDSLCLLKEYIEKEEYRGYDPYDALKSPLFKLPLFRSNKTIRFGSQQVIRRFPVNLRPLLFIPKGLNPVTLGLSIQAYTYLYLGDNENKEEYLKKIKHLTTELVKLIPHTYSGACWGYDFDWEARYTHIPAYKPTVVATGIITNALYEAYNATGYEELANLIKSAALFVINDLNRTYEGDIFLFSYSPFDKQEVLNASMKATRLLSQAYILTKDEHYIELANKSAACVMKHQNIEGAWPYAINDPRKWIDNYHTGYIIDCLDSYINLSSNTAFLENLNKALCYYKNHFITTEGIPKFYHNKVYPIDCTSASQTILTLCRFGSYDLATKVAFWVINEMQANNGSFHFRKHKYFKTKTPFMRWSNAWMFAALTYLKLKTNHNIK